MDDSIPVLQLGKVIDSESNSFQEFEIILNNKPIDSSKAFIEKQVDTWILNISDLRIYIAISNYPIKNLFLTTNSIACMFIFDVDTALDYFYISSIYINKEKSNCLEISFGFDIDFIKWTNNWSIREHLDNFLTLINSSRFQFKNFKNSIDYTNYQDSEFDFLSYYISINEYELQPQDTLGSVLNEFTEIFYDANKEIEKKYQSSLTTYSLTERFNFPPEVKTACEQYLLYFAEFLNDIAGIGVNASLNPDGESTIFSIQPKNKDEALETIGQYLKAYLRFPGSELLNSIQVSSDLSLQAQNLKIQVDNLKNQLDIANLKRQMIGAVIELKDQTIQDKNTEISRLGQQLQESQITIRVMAESLQKKEDEEESILGNALKVKDYEAPGGLIVGTPEIVRKIKRFLGID